MTREEREDAIQFFARWQEKRSIMQKYGKLAIEALEQEPLEDIKAEIKQKREENRNGEYDKIFELCLLIIDKHTSGKEQE